MSRGDAIGDKQPETKPAAARLGSPDKRLEQGRLHILRNRLSGVRDTHGNALSAPFHLHVNRLARSAMLQRIVDQVQGHLPHGGGIERRARLIGRLEANSYSRTRPSAPARWRSNSTTTGMGQCASNAAER